MNEIDAINKRNREGVARFQEANPTHRFKHAADEDSMVCLDCRQRVTGEELIAVNYNLRCKPCKAA